MLKRLIVFSIVSVNIGYTGFLFPLLGVLYPNRVPLTMYNLLAFIFIDTIWGIILATIIYFVIHIAKINLTKATMFSIGLTWTTFWLISILSTRDFNITSIDNTMVIGVDGIAALITWIILSRLIKYYMLLKRQHTR